MTQYSNPALVRVAFQVYGILFEVMKESATEHLDDFFGNVQHVLQQALDIQESTELEENPDSAAPEWQSAYQALCAAEKVLGNF